MNKIDKNVPIPSTGAGRNTKYPWYEMEVGDSFFADIKSTSISLPPNLLMRGVRFLRREVVVDGIVGTRVWRIK